MQVHVIMFGTAVCARLYTPRDSVYQISARLLQLRTARSPFFIQLATRSIRSVRDCSSCVQLARLSLYSSRLGLSDQREIAPAVCARLSLYSSRLGLSDQSEVAVLCTARCFGVGPADVLTRALCLPAVQGSVETVKCAV